MYLGNLYYLSRWLRNLSTVVYAGMIILSTSAVLLYIRVYINKLTLGF